MTLLVSALWPGLAGALLLGACIGALTGLPRERASLIAAASLVVALAVLGGLTVSQTVPGQAGLWVETATLMLAAYLVGCLAGGAGHRLRRRARA
ncbi:hypothetical protein [Methylobacterium gnaphalii]|uniref:Uncharacterized protein n=1 Tax=Methylobacterium gnaphalii TaxID=1010610 RepID=A0A512JHC6_9HYPH|nr:hypothetical protein [Methylobacterium gnaphalii]GEP09367.1 hypothetical protein MGN01_12120 [Methylobacterium gnaphalii]GJD68151.1 hypothetical protein MMMDOFMJ_1069 [Methylobacterium gnaphalii]GLS51744.1 hypothetical protein GCM10007885_46050 [Methylobacterium gnaphalii]